MSIFVSTIVCFFAVFGVIQMILNIKQTFFSNNTIENFTIVVTVKNQQDTIEGTLRNIVWNSLHNIGGKTVPHIIAVDLGSEDDTLAILQKLSTKYDFITVTNKDQYIKVMEQGLLQ